MSAKRTVFRLGLVRLFCIATIAAASISGIYRASAAIDNDSNVIAIGVLLDPEVAMVRYAQAANADLRRIYPPGYTLAAARCPRITLVQRFIRTSDIPEMSAAVAQAADEARATTLQLTTNGYDYEFRNGERIGVMSLNVEASDPLRVLEARIVEAVQPFAVTGGTAYAFAEPVTRGTVDWTEHFVPTFSGKNFSPQLTIGVAPTEYLEALKSRPFLPLGFGVIGVSIYQLGNTGTPQELIWESDGIDACACPFLEE